MRKKKRRKKIEKDENKILWDISIQTDKVIENSRSDIVVLNKITPKCVLIDIASPFDIHINEKEQNNIEVYGDLRNEIKIMWKCREVVIVPVIGGALGIIRSLRNGWRNWKSMSKFHCYKKPV